MPHAESAGRKETPTYGLVDSQSVKTLYPSEEGGIDGEKTKGRKRHIVTDVMGNILAVIVHAANIYDTVSGVGVAKAAHGKYPSIKGFCGDMGYKGTFVTEISKIPGVHVDISEKIKPHEWEKLRWR